MKIVLDLDSVGGTYVVDGVDEDMSKGLTEVVDGVDVDMSKGLTEVVCIHYLQVRRHSWSLSAYGLKHSYKKKKNLQQSLLAI